MKQSEEQVVLVTAALIEAAEHMSELLKVNDIPAFQQILSSYLNALKALEPHAHAMKKKSLTKLIKEIQQNLSSILAKLRDPEIDKTIALVATLQSRTISLHEQISSEIDNRPTIIGLYHAENNPVLSYNNNRIAALYKEAEKQNCKLYMFESKDVNMQTSTIQARKSLNTEETETIDLPDVIYNIFPKINYVHDEVEKWLRTKAPFSTFPINNKIDLPEKIAAASDLGHLFLPFKKVRLTDDVFAFLQEYEQVVLKKYAAARGESIYFIKQRSVDEYEVKAKETTHLFNQAQFNSWLEANIVDEKFIVQQYKQFLTTAKEPYDIRAHVQKDGRGNWVLTKMYPRIGAAGTIISNVSQGGRTEDIEEFLQAQFTEEKAPQLKTRLTTLALRVAKTIDTIYEQSIDELGLDLAIDAEEKIYMHEANLKPRIRYYEAERAVNTIGYLKYLAKHRLFLTNEVQKL